jgi:hypothetical protein
MRSSARRRPRKDDQLAPDAYKGYPIHDYEAPGWLQ